MRSLLLITLAVLSGSTSAGWSGLRTKSPATRLSQDKEGPPTDSNVANLLDRDIATSGLYQHARAEIQLISKRSSCHRTILAFYVRSCHMLDEVDTQSGDLIQDYIDSFAASLAICDLKAADASITRSCESFQDSTLREIATTNTRGLHTTRAQIGHCMKGLHADQNSWVSFNGNKETANSLCRTAKEDLSREKFLREIYTLVLHLEEVNREEGQRKKQQDEEYSNMKHHFQNLRNSVNDIRTGVSDIWDQAVAATQGVGQVLHNAATSAQAVDAALMRILQSLMEGNAEHALAQQNARVATTDLTTATETAEQKIWQLISEFEKNLTALAAAQTTSTQRAVDTMNHNLYEVQNLTESVLTDLLNANGVIQALVGHAEEVVNSFSAWTFGMHSNSTSRKTWLLFIICPLLSVFVIGHGIPATYTRNVALVLVGFFIAATLTFVLNIDSYLSLFRAQLAGISNSSIEALPVPSSCEPYDI